MSACLVMCCIGFLRVWPRQLHFKIEFVIFTAMDYGNHNFFKISIHTKQ